MSLPTTLPRTSPGNVAYTEGLVMSVAFSSVPTSEPGSPAPARAPLGVIGKRARATNLSRAYEIQATLMRAAAGRPVTEAGLEAAVRAAHQIVGSAGTFGMATASAVAHQLEQLLARANLRDEAGLMIVIGALDALLHELNAEPTAADASAGPPPAPTITRHSMLIAVPEPSLASRITGAARARGWETRWATDLEGATTELEWAAPDVVLLGLDLPPDGTALIRRAGEHTPPIPTIVLLGEDDVLDRVEASRAGAMWFASTEMEPEDVVTAASDALSRPGARRRRILAVDDDPVILDYLCEVLREASLDITTVADPLQFWEKLNETHPDLVLLDVDMPRVSGIDLCRLIRSDPRWADLPVLVLTGTIHPTNVTGLFAAGADDYVAKPVLGPELISRITNRLDRVQLLRRMAETDPLTGIANRAGFEKTFADLRSLAERRNQPLSLALLDVDDFRRINTEHGYELGDQVILRLAALLDGSFHGEDLVARWSGTELAVAMLGLDRSDGVARIADVLEAFRMETVGTGRDLPVRATFTASVAEQDVDGHDLYALLQHLGATMGAGKRAGGDRVLPVGWRPVSETAVVDVAHLSADVPSAVLLQRALRTRGLHGEHLGSGEDAVDRLLGPEGLRTRVVLVDDDPAHIDALAVLARLASGGILDRSRAIVVSARPPGAETAEMASLGVFDHVAKPADVPVLVQRIRRALAT